MAEQNTNARNVSEIYTFPISQANIVVRAYIEQIKKYNESHSADMITRSRKKLIEFIQHITSFEKLSGDANDIHNLSVELYRAGEYALSCYVLQYGLKFYPRNVDLLADYLQSGIRCNQFENCRKYYESLKKIPEKFWTCRGFVFSIDYLLYLVKNTEIESAEEYQRLYDEMISIVKSYREYFPHTEDSYKEEADIYAFFDKEKEVKLLENVINNDLVASYPKCSLRYAELKMEEGDYDEAADGVLKALSSFNKSKKGVQSGYLYYMAGLLKLSKILANEGASDFDVRSGDITDIYNDFNTALPLFENNSEEYKEGIKDKTKYLIGKYRVKVPSKLKNLNCFIEKELDE